MHKNAEVLFEVDGVKKKLNSIIGVKQGDLLGPELFTFYMSAVLETWRSLHSYDLCIMRSKEDFILTGRNHNKGGKNLNGKRYTEFAVSGSEYADDTAIPFTSVDQTLRFSHRCSWNILEDGDLKFMQALIASTKNPRRKFYFAHGHIGLTKIKELSMRR